MESMKRNEADGPATGIEKVGRAGLVSWAWL